MTTKTKTTAKSPKTTETFGKWVRQIPRGASSTPVTLQVPITLSEKAWVILAVDAAQREITLNEHLQGTVDSYLELVQDDLRLVGKAA
jgi:hypothetical protein